MDVEEAAPQGRELFRPWDSKVEQVPASDDEAGKQSKNAAVSCKYSDSGSLLAVASADKKCLIYSSTTGAVVANLSAGGHSLGLNDVAWLSEQMVATVSDDKMVKLWDIEAGKVISSCSGHKSFVYCIDVHPETRLLYTGGYDGAIRVFHAASSSCAMNFSGHAGAVVSLHISPKDGGQEFVTGSLDGVCRLWDSALPSCCKRSIFSDAVPGISNARFSPNGQFILVSTLDGVVSLYPSQGDSPPKGVAGAGAVKRYVGHTNSRYSLQACFFSGLPGAEQFMLQGSEDGALCVWDLDTMELVQRGAFHSDAVLASACNPNAAQRQVATAGRDGKVQFWSYVA